jgi:uncharacterized protein
MISNEDKTILLELARNAISTFLFNKDLVVSGSIKSKFEKKQGVFVTLKKANQLRGCIGFIEPFFPLSDGIIEAARSAAFKDPRFDSLTKEEFDLIKIEISLLTEPKQLVVKNCSDYLDLIKIGEHGLIIRSPKGKSGLLLPQVASEQKFDVLDFLEAVSEKAYLDRDSWRYLENKIFIFETIIFSE